MMSRVLRRPGVLLLALSLAVLGMAVPAANAATSPDPGGAVTIEGGRPFTTMYDEIIVGDFTIVGNALVECVVTCTQNSGVNERYLDADSNPSTVQSSAATFTVPAGAKVTHAYLTLAYYVRPTDPADKLPGYDLGGFKMSVNSDQNYQTVYAEPGRHSVSPQGPLASAQIWWMSATADVTSQLAGATGTQTVWVADPPPVDITLRMNQAEGWGLTVVYEWPTVDVAAGHVARSVLISEGQAIQFAGGPSTDINVATPPITDTTQVRMGVIAVEGDRGAGGDTLEVGTSAATLQFIPEPTTNSTTDFFTSYADGASSPASNFNQSVDAKTFGLPANVLPNGGTSALLRMKTSSEGFALQVAAFSVPVAALILTKTADSTSYDSTDDVITYTFEVYNPSSVAIDNVTVADALPGLGTIDCAPLTNGSFSLAPGETAKCTAPYQVQASDIGADKEVVNSATATGVDPGGNTSVSRPATVTIPCENCEPGISLTKTVAPAEGREGDSVTYTLTTTNTGNSVLTNVTISDPLPGLGAFTCTVNGAAATNGSATLNPGEAMICTAPYVLTAADIAKGSVENTASVTGTPPPGQVAPTAEANQTVKTLFDAMTIAKLVSLTGDCADAAESVEVTTPGPVTYCYTITNTGNTTLTGLKAVDDMATPGAVGDDEVAGLASTTLAPGATTTGTVKGVITQAQIDAGTALTNTVALTSDQIATPVTDTATVTIKQSPSFTVSKTVTGTGNCADAVESLPVEAVGTVTYCYTMTNTGNVTLTGLAGVDDMATPSDTADDATLTWAPSKIAPGETATATVTATITQAQFDARDALTNTVSATTAEAPDPVTDTAEVTIVPKPSMTIVKLVSVTGDCSAAVPAVAIAQPTKVTYCYTVTNTGNVSLNNVTGVDDLATASDTADDVTVKFTPTVIAPGATGIASIDVDLTQAQVDAGTALTNTISATSDEITTPVTDTAEVTMTQGPALTVAKSVTVTGACADATDSVQLTAPTEVTYCYTLTNTGNVTLTDVKAVDDMATKDDTGDDVTLNLDKTTLAPGESATASLVVDILQPVIDAGAALTNTVSGTSAQTPDPVTDTATVTPVQKPSFTVTKLVSETGDCADAAKLVELSKVGSVTYCYVITNTGNVTLTDLKAVDDMATSDKADDQSPVFGATELAPGASTSASLEVEITQAQLDAKKSLVNTISVTSAEVPDPVMDTATVELKPIASFTVDKAVTLTGDCADAGDKVAVTKPGKVTFCFTVTNTGATTLTNVKAIDNLATSDTRDDVIVTLAKTTLAPGESTTGTLEVTITEEQLKGDDYVNTVGVTTAETGTLVVSDIATVIPRPTLPPTGDGDGKSWLDRLLGR